MTQKETIHSGKMHSFFLLSLISTKTVTLESDSYLLWWCNIFQAFKMIHHPGDIIPHGDNKTSQVDFKRRFRVSLEIELAVLTDFYSQSVRQLQYWDGNIKKKKWHPKTGTLVSIWTSFCPPDKCLFTVLYLLCSSPWPKKSSCHCVL